MHTAVPSRKTSAVLVGFVTAAILGLGIALFRVGSVSAQATAPPPASTPRQIEAGRAAYVQQCASCHGANLNDGTTPPLNDASFRSTWMSKPPATLANFLRGSMPPNNAGGLTAAMYSDISAYLFSANGAAAPLAATTQSAPPAGADSQTANPRPGAPSARDVQGGSSPALFAPFATRSSPLLDALTPVTDANLEHPADGDWTMWRRTYNGWGYSPLTQITRNNVKDLQTAWTWTLTPGVSETTPLVHDGVLFVHNSGDKVQALDGATGDLLWEYVRKLSPEVLGSGNQLTKRNMAIYGDTIITATADVHLVALNQKTGAVVWDVEVADWKKGYRFSGGPMVADGKIIQGMAGCRNSEPGGCFITAHDPTNGKELWRVHTVAQDGKEGDTWNGVPVAERFGASAWMSGTYDPVSKVIYYGTGNSYQLIPGVFPAKPGANNDALYTNSTLAIDAATGKLKWYFQHLQTDLLDLYYPYERMLIDLPVNGVLRHQVITTGKPAIIESLDSANGKWLWSQETVPQNIVAAIDPVTGRKTINPAVLPGPNRVPNCPADPGGRGWPATAYDPQNHVLYLPLNEFCSGTTGLTPGPKSNGKAGRIDAVDLATKATLWSDHQYAPLTSAVLPTAGGVVFAGDLDRYFSAYDSASGKLLWRTRTSSVVNSYPVTYSVKGKQYVAVVVGTGSTMPRQLSALTRDIPIPAAGTVLFVFALPDKRE